MLGDSQTSRKAQVFLQSWHTRQLYLEELWLHLVALGVGFPERNSMVPHCTHSAEAPPPYSYQYSSAASSAVPKLNAICCSTSRTWECWLRCAKQNPIRWYLLAVLQAWSAWETFYCAQQSALQTTQGDLCPWVLSGTAWWIWKGSGSINSD